MKRHKTPTPSARQRPLPQNAKEFVVAADTTAAESLDLLHAARTLGDQVLERTPNPVLREPLHQLARNLADVVGNLEYIQRMLLSARIGRE